ncbi:hypothetical protein H6X68_11995 [Actinomyces sp. 186855]|nr:hypothetical protein [Actinomyces sp. 186855]
MSDDESIEAVMRRIAERGAALESAERAIVDAADKWDEAGGPWLMPDRMVVDNLVQAICAWRKLKGM